MAVDNEDQGLLSLTTEIVASFVGNNAMASADLPAVITAVFGTLAAEKPATRRVIRIGAPMSYCASDIVYTIQR